MSVADSWDVFGCETEVTLKNIPPFSNADEGTPTSCARNVTQCESSILIIKLIPMKFFMQLPIELTALRSGSTQLSHAVRRWAIAILPRKRAIAQFCVSLLLMVGCLTLLSPTPAYAGLKDDRYDGNIFPLYAGNGAMVPPRITLAQALKRNTPTLLFFYIDDSSDCKEYVSTISQLDAFYGRVADFISIDIDAIPVKSSYEPTEPGAYYKGLVPQTVLFDPSGKIVLNETGIVPFEKVDDAFREVFNLLPRSESVELRRRPINEISGEIAP